MKYKKRNHIISNNNQKKHNNYSLFTYSLFIIAKKS